ncbi:MAG: DUF1835 domain-containing protein [Candidatus Eremiobacteraeota bacterium]|nr:DUF1835 domain-containing protein [Candidatus Eremiobacteraeota bacterium]MBV9057312.1 DUF1835 domain-containing protein [Candidatus Eremiobacteraeota bacterium]MBV9699538.1 DUF1835 domain-containing protein [Candidatus Eremiobacteraeota bacterium]
MAAALPALHITNGDGAVALLKKAAIIGRHVAWRDALNEGPVPAGLSLEETSAVRSRYLGERGYGHPIRLIADFARRDQLVRRAGEFAEIVLWFEHDLYDQLQLLQSLTSLEEHALEPGRIWLVQSDHYLTALTAEQIVALHAKRRIATAAAFKSARRTWERFTSATSDALRQAAVEDAIGLPFLKGALQRLCQEYPWKRDGVSRSQRQMLYAVAQGPASNDELFARTQMREEAAFLTAGAFAMILRDLRSADAPLIEDEGGSLNLTALGRRVIAGDVDWLEHHAIDRWIGGVHLVGESVTRWDDDLGSLV